MRAEELIKMIAAEIEVGQQGTIKSLLLQENWMWSLGGVPCYNTQSRVKAEGTGG